MANAVTKSNAAPKGTPSVISSRGKLDIWIVAASRLGYALSLGGLLTLIAWVVSGLALQKTAARSGEIGSGAQISSDVGVAVSNLNSLAEGLNHYLGATTLIGMLACVGIMAACQFFELDYGQQAARRQEASLHQRITKSLFQGTYLIGTKPAQPAKLVTMLTDSSERVTQYRQCYFGATIAAIAIPFLTLGYVAIWVDWLLGIALLILCCLVPGLIIGFLKAFRKISSQSRRERGRLSAKYLDAIRHLVMIRLLGAGKRIETELREAGERNRGAIMRLLAGNQIVIIVLDGAFSLLLICAVAGLGLWRYQMGAISLFQTYQLSLFSILLIEPLVQVAGFFYLGMGGKAAGRSLQAFFADSSSGQPNPTGIKQQTSQVSSDEVSRASQTKAGKVRALAGKTDQASLEYREPVEGIRADKSAWQVSQGGKNGSAGSVLKANSERGSRLVSQRAPGITLENVSYDYGRGVVLKGISGQVLPGERVAIIGRSGSGKSTLLSLLAGTIPLQQGSIQIGGQILPKSPLWQIQSLSALVTQKTWLFTGTIADNLHLANPDASEAQMWQALKQAQLAEEVQRMPQGLQTDLGEGGALISGGQAQRLSLARAFLSGRKLFLLDEPTSQVDMESEAKIRQAIDQISDDCTVVLVTHRYSLLPGMDQVWNLQGGQLSLLDQLSARRALSEDPGFILGGLKQVKCR